MALTPDYTKSFQKDVKLLKRRHTDMQPLRQVIELVLENSRESIEGLKRRHNMHVLKGKWRGANECHVANAGDWLLIWKTGNGLAVFQRTGTHDQIFR
ncbi:MULTISPECIES: type II toxin-antitoxin system YafQ family toxin [Trueperella]|uniref:mRNA interferase YafQ n=1 Tax=Trueperella abortisuis TaxID=445930 RepID=A0ABT9PHY0_9ACTO|nr:MULTISPECIES: type II toxin-antitoxin system YafQ family toxin [Trueperella]MDP9831750.1 mRNA interferase YafQ [Trueperella abortisuis]MDY5404606.1 type II toxin-antitoxin system YafQ family toxin [Trueperella sp.]